MIKVIVADDHPVLRAGVVQVISSDAEIQVVGEADTGEALAALLTQKVPDVLLLDINMPGFDVFKQVPRLRRHYPGMKILVVTAYDNEEYVRALVKMGVSGYLLKEEDLSTYVEAIREVALGGFPCSKRVITAAINGGMDVPTLTARECEVLDLVARGEKSQQIAIKLHIAKRTVDFHVSNICHKLGVDNRTAAAAKASGLGLIAAWKKQEK